MDATVDAGSGQFELTEDQLAIRDMAEAFADDASRRTRSTGTRQRISRPM